MEQQQEAPREALVRRGAIFHSDAFDDIDHGKFFVIIGVSEDCVVGLFFINSNINSFICGKPDLYALQYTIKAKDYESFLRYDSFVSCSSLRRFPLDRFEASITSGRTECKGQLREEHLQDILKLVKDSPVFSKRDREAFFS